MIDQEEKFVQLTCDKLALKLRLVHSLENKPHLLTARFCIKCSPDYRLASLELFGWVLDNAPTLVAATPPSLKRRSVGNAAWIPNPVVFQHFGRYCLPIVSLLSAVLVCDFIKNRCTHLTRATPFCPKINKNRACSVDHIVLKTVSSVSCCKILSLIFHSNVFFRTGWMITSK